jgi:two-component system phosphate regulon sensor histidine kinase PhoR
VALLSATTAGLALHTAIRRDIIEQEIERITLALRLAADLLARDGLAFVGPPAADAAADRLGAELGVRVTIIAADGVVLGDSDLDAEGLARAENHASREEVHQALGGRSGHAVRRSATLGREMLYAARPIDPGHPERGVIRLALPLTAVSRAQARVGTLLAGAALLAVAIAGLAGWMAARRPARRLQEMSAAAADIAAGRMGARAHPGSGDDEVADLGRSLNRMAGQLEDRLALLGRERNQLHALVEGMVEGVLLLDAEGRIVLANAAFARMFRVQGPLAGRTPLESARVPALREAIDAALVADEPVERDLTLPADPPRDIRASLAAIREAGGIVGAVAVFHDVTELRRLEQVRREFVANVSHELRTPLTAIKGYAETLLDGGLADPVRSAEFVEVIARHTERLGVLIEDLLDLAAVEQGEARVEMGSVRLGEVVSQAESVVRAAAAEKGLAVQVDLPPTLPQVRADRDRLAQVLINLLDNAVKFTPPGGRVGVAAGSSDGLVTIAVSDTGVGIPPADLPRIFERFYRVDRSRDRREGGTGLGLAIAKHLTTAMGGQIEVTSRPGAGSTFRVTLRAA